MIGEDPSLMEQFTETEISTGIVDAYYKKLRRALQSDVVIVGAGPSGLTAAWTLASGGFHVVVLEKRLSPGGGIWGGSTGMNDIVVQREALDLVTAVGARHRAQGSLFVIDALELASALCLKALQAGATILNLMTAEDVCLHGKQVTGVVANRSLIGESLPVDPLVFTAKAVIDATGHEAVVANFLARRGQLKLSHTGGSGEGPMNAQAGEAFVVERVQEAFPGLWVAGMSVCATQGGPRMGPIFGGMLMSGAKVARLVSETLKKIA
ncbi:MAG: thiazole biosynthesis protein [Methanothrix sp.]|nr:MAG: thiazole biosynthesis protein [Methanothrix sp.]